MPVTAILAIVNDSAEVTNQLAQNLYHAGKVFKAVVSVSPKKVPWKITLESFLRQNSVEVLVSTPWGLGLG